MAEISIVQAHSLTPQQARAAAQKVADKMAGEYSVAYEWKGDVLHFERSGVHGALAVQQEQVAMTIKLGFLMSALAPGIEAKVAEKMKKVFAPA